MDENGSIKKTDVYKGESLMGAEIIQVCRERLPSLRFIGKRYTDADRRSDGSFGNKWGEWFEKGWFAQLEALGELQDIENGYLGLMGCSEEEKSFEYWIGIFFPDNTPVPEGFTALDIPEGDVGVCWIYGNEKTDNIYGMHSACMEKLRENGMGNFRDDFKGGNPKWWWFFERYHCPRFTTPDENGKIILDYGMYLA